MVRSRWKVLFLFVLTLPYLQPTAKAEESVEILADRHGIFDETKGTITFEKNVSARMLSTGAVLYSDRLEVFVDPISRKPMKARAEGQVRLLDKKGEVHCDLALFKRNGTTVELLGNVKLRTPQLELDGARVHYDYETGWGRITALPQRQVTFAFDRGKSDAGKNRKVGGEKKSEPIHWTSGRATRIFVYRKSKKALLQGDVAFKDVRRHSELSADRVELFFAPDDDIEEAVASGRFSLVQNKRHSKADSAVFDYKTEIVTLRGNALIEEPGRGVVSSPTIKMHMKESKGQLQSDGRRPIRTLITID